MFACLTVHEPVPGGIIQKLFNILTGPKTQAQLRTICGTEYLHIEAWPGKNGIDWQQVRHLAGRFAERLLLPQGYTLPPGSGLRVASGEKFAREVLKHTACEVIKRTRMPMYRRMLGLIDSDGTQAGALYDLLKFYTAVKVVTQAEELYEAAARDMMERLGAPVLLCGDMRGLTECVLIFAAGNWSPPPEFTPGCPVLCGSLQSAAPHFGWDVFSAPWVDPPADFLAEVPPAISPQQFLEALYEYGGLHPAGFIAAGLLYNQKAASLNEAAEILSRRAGTHALI